MLIRYEVPMSEEPGTYRCSCSLWQFSGADRDGAAIRMLNALRGSSDSRRVASSVAHTKGIALLQSGRDEHRPIDSYSGRAFLKNGSSFVKDLDE